MFTSALKKKCQWFSIIMSTYVFHYRLLKRKVVFSKSVMDGKDLVGSILIQLLYKNTTGMDFTGKQEMKTRDT